MRSTARNNFPSSTTRRIEAPLFVHHLLFNFLFEEFNHLDDGFFYFIDADLGMEAIEATVDWAFDDRKRTFVKNNQVHVAADAVFVVRETLAFEMG